MDIFLESKLVEIVEQLCEDRNIPIRGVVVCFIIKWHMYIRANNSLHTSVLTYMYMCGLTCECRMSAPKL